ncbi:MAG: hypothetical protein M3Q80_00430 [bacterium]|nr:hypothetical protein [bacterium]
MRVQIEMSSTMTKERTVKIIGVPDRMQMAAALLVGDQESKTALTFKVKSQVMKEPWTEHVKVNIIAREDGGGNNFIIEGYNTANFCPVCIFVSLRTNSGTMTYQKK